MKFTAIIFISFLFSQVASAHNYYFGFAEMQYNSTNQTLETTVVLSAHDFEDILMKKGLISKSLEYLTADTAVISTVGTEVLRGFKVVLNGKSIDFESLGFEVTRNGMINIYLLAKNITINKQVEITFDCLMETFPEQQNKLTFIYQAQKYTAVFLPHQKSAVIKIQ